MAKRPAASPTSNPLRALAPSRDISPASREGAKALSNDTVGGIPEGWALGRVDDNFRSWGGATPSTSDSRFWDGSIPWISSKDVKKPRITSGTHFVTETALEKSRLRVCPRGSVLVVIRSGVLVHTLPVAITDGEVVINQDLKAFVSPNLTMNEWLALALRALAPNILEANRKDGTTVQSIRFDQLKDLRLAIPPLAEQRRIVARVEALLGRVQAARARLAKVPALLKRFRQSVLAAACSGELTKDWREDQSEKTYRPTSVDIGHLFPIPDGWKWTQMNDIIASIRSGSTAVPQLEETGYPILRSSSVRRGHVDLDDVRFLNADESHNPDNYVANGDLLFTRLSGSLEYVANCGMVRGLDDLKVQYPDRLFRVRFKDPRFSVYVELVFGAPFVRALIEAGAKSSAGHQRISIGTITTQLVPLPPIANSKKSSAASRLCSHWRTRSILGWHWRRRGWRRRRSRFWPRHFGANWSRPKPNWPANKTATTNPPPPCSNVFAGNGITSRKPVSPPSGTTQLGHGGNDDRR